MKELTIKELLNRLFDHQYLSQSEAKSLMHNIANKAVNEAQIASIITTFLMRNVSTDELLGFREALLEMADVIDLSSFEPIDIVGTGGDGHNTFNISTAAAFVVAGAGYKVAKHGNYGATSISGASNVLEYLGAKFTNQEDRLMRSIDESGMAFLHAPLFNKAMKSVAPIRKELGVRTIFNMLGPLVNPAKPTYQLLGVYNLPLLRMYNYTLQTNHSKYAIVHSLDGYDEISLTDTFKVTTNRGENLYIPEMFGLEKNTPEQLFGGNSIAEAAEIFINVLKGEALDSQINAVAINAAFAINLRDPKRSIEESIAIAKESISSGRAYQSLTRFIKLNS